MGTDESNWTFRLLDRRVSGPLGGETFFSIQGRDYSYSEVYRLVNGLARRISESGVNPGDRVLICVESPLDFCIASLAAMRVGAVCLLFGARLREKDDRLLEYLEKLEATASLADAGTIPFLPASLKPITPDPVAIPASGWESLATDDVMPCAPVGLDDPVMAFFTSGTTGLPKCAVHSQRITQPEYHLWAGAIMGLHPGARCLVASPIFFSFSIALSIIISPMFGASSVLAPRLNPAHLRQTIALDKPTTLGGLPTTFAALAQLEAGENTGALDSVRRCVCAGETLPRGVADDWLRTMGFPLVEIIGSADLATIYVANDPENVRMDYTGRPTSGFVARLVDDQGQEVGKGEPGELVLWGWGLPFLGYLADGRLEQTLMRDGWFHTGDLMREGEDGFMSYVGRKDHRAKAGGCWVYPEELEKALLLHPVINEAVVMVVTPEGRPTVIVACVAGQEEGSVLSTEARKVVREATREGRAPIRVISFPGGSLPRGQTGKADRGRLARQALEKLA